MVLKRTIFQLLFCISICTFLLTANSFAGMPSKINGIYLPPDNFSKRRLMEFKYYCDHTGMNAVVLHVKDPHGQVHWNSENPIAKEIGAVAKHNSIAKTVQYLKSNKIWTIAKVDVFIDNKLARSRPEYGAKNSETGELWVDFSGLNWSNPYDTRVWDYNISLCTELVKAGFDEIQFDYTRFPSDGNLSLIEYPLKTPEISMSKCIGRFLEKAYSELKPLGVYISVDVFGLTAWKKTDFGVGQVLEDISPHVDVICPMFYPSHFPKGFLGLSKPDNHPGRIMQQSTKMIMKRSNKKIRPWVQGFWYPPKKISLQIQAIQRAGISDWMVWNSGGNYEKTYLALVKNLSEIIPPFQFYPDLSELKKKGETIIRGKTTLINYTNYLKEYSILSLEKYDRSNKVNYSIPISVVHTMDEAILDLLLIKNNFAVARQSGKYIKSIHIADILCRQINRDPHKIKPQPIYVDWGNTGAFSLSIPPDLGLNTLDKRP